eukprot:scaffold2036_cov115-Isochrysis_galbana.AAC.19
MSGEVAGISSTSIDLRIGRPTASASAVPSPTCQAVWQGATARHRTAAAPGRRAQARPRRSRAPGRRAGGGPRRQRRLRAAPWPVCRAARVAPAATQTGWRRARRQPGGTWPIIPRSGASRAARCPRPSHLTAGSAASGPMAGVSIGTRTAKTRPAAATTPDPKRAVHAARRNTSTRSRCAAVRAPRLGSAAAPRP